MGRRPCCSKVGLNKGAWTKLEDKILTDYIKLHGEGNWNNLPKLAGLKRCGKSCRLRWVNYLRPDIKRGNISQDEEDLIIRMHKLIGNRWSLIAGRLPGRTDNEIKNYWNTTLRKKLEPTRTKVASSRKIAKENGPKPESEPKNIVKSTQHVKPIRTKAFRFTSNIQTAMPTNFQFSSGADEECNGSNEELTTNHHSPIDENPSLEAANLMIDSCDCDDHDPQMNHNTIETFNHDHTYSPPMVDDQGLQEWIIRSNPNFNLYTSIFEDDLGVLDFDSLGTLLDFGQEWS